MSGLLGVAGAPGLHAKSRSLAPHFLLRHTDEGIESVEGPTVAFAVAQLQNDRRHSVWRDEGLMVAVYGSPHWADKAPSSGFEARRADPAEIGSRYLEQGASMLGHLSGGFGLAIEVHRPDGRELLLAADRLGIEAICFARAGDGVVFGTRADAVAALAGHDEIDPQAIYDYLYFHMVPAPRTIFRGVERLLPGSFLLWRKGELAIQNYWKARFVESNGESVANLRRPFQIKLQEGVTRAVDCAGDSGAAGTGCFLSGGTDSSTVAGMFTKATGQAARTFSIGFDAPGYDELGYARVAARHFSTRQHEYYVTPADVVAAVGTISAAHDQPFGNASVIPAYYCARLAREQGVALMLAGDGGDELYGGNERYATQYLFSLYDRVPAPLRSTVIEPLLGALPAVGPVGKAQSYVRQANVRLPDRLQNYNLIRRIGPANVLDDGFIAGIDLDEPVRLLREVYDGADADAQINRMLALDLKFTLADSDLPKVNRACEMAGIRVAYPMLDPAVVDFSLGLRPEYKLKGRQLRWFFKEALRDFLPPEIIEKKKHGFGLPFGVWLRQDQALRELAGDTLGSLRKRGIIRSALIDELLSKRIAEHAGYFGTLVWVLMTLEIWLGRPKVAEGRGTDPGHPTQ